MTFGVQCRHNRVRDLPRIAAYAKGRLMIITTGADYDAALGWLAGLGIAGGIIILAILVCTVVAYFLAIGSLVKAARAKNSSLGSGRLWFVGIFTTPIVLAFIVLALPDRGQQMVVTTAAQPGLPTTSVPPVA